MRKFLVVCFVLISFLAASQTKASVFNIAMTPLPASVPDGTVFSNMEITFTNTTDKPKLLQGVQLYGDFAVAPAGDNCIERTLQPDQFCTIYGSYTAHSDAKNYIQLYYGLQGIKFGPVNFPVPTITEAGDTTLQILSHGPASADDITQTNYISFDDQPSHPGKIWIKNTGTHLTRNLSVNLGSEGEGFRLNDGTCTSALAPGASCYVNLEYQPTSQHKQLGTVGRLNTTVNVYNDADLAASVVVQGIAATASTTDFLRVPDDSERFSGVTIGNALTDLPNTKSMVYDAMNHQLWVASKDLDVSSDDGEHFISSFKLPQNVAASGLVIDGNRAFLATNEGIFIGQPNHWSIQDIALPQTKIYAIAANGKYIYAGTLQGLYMSSDDGATWSSNPVAFTDEIVTTMVNYGNKIYAGVYGSEGSKVYVTTDHGQHWTATGLAVQDDAIIYSLVHGAGYMIASAAEDDLHQSIAHHSRSNSSETFNYISHDGEHWQAIGLGNTMATSPIIKYDGQYYVGTYQGIFVSTNTINWTPLQNRLSNQMVTGLSIGDTFWYAFTEAGVYRSTDHGITWTPSSSVKFSDSFAPYINNFLANGNDGFILSTYKGLYQGNLAAGQQAILGLVGKTINRTVKIADKYYALEDNDNATAPAGGLSISNNGQTWDNATHQLPGTNVHSLTLFDNNFYAGIYGEDESGYTKGLYKTNNPNTWLTTADAFANKAITDTISFNNKLYAAVYVASPSSENGIYSSTNGTDWPATPEALSGKNIALLYKADGTLFAGTSTGLYATQSGQAWTEYLDNKNITAIQQDSTGKLYIGTFNGLWVGQLGELVEQPIFSGKHISALGLENDEIYIAVNNDHIYTLAKNVA